MTQEQKDLLLKDLCARLPYGVRCLYFDAEGNKHIDLLNAVFPNDDMILVGKCSIDYSDSDILGVVPYLFPLSNMTEEQEEEYCTMYEENRYSWRENIIDWFNKNHFDYRNLIDKNLAIDCTNLNIY